jgi:uncharacterized protein YbjT (DUF2867 family)
MLLGATGLVGRECRRLLDDDPDVSRIVVITRRPIDDASPKTQVERIDFETMASHGDLFEVDQIFCALGTTIKEAGSRAVFRHVDFDYPITAARLGALRGAHHFLLVSALGASASSRVFYNRVKGELEDALRTLSYRSITIVRPSLLLGQRAEFRLGEQIVKRIGWLAPGKYKPVRAVDVARTLVKAAQDDKPGMRIIESNDIR